MRVTCTHCRQRFDVPHRKVLEEAERLRTVRAGLPVTMDPSAPLPDDDIGNRLTPEEIERRNTPVLSTINPHAIDNLPAAGNPGRRTTVNRPKRIPA